MITNEEPQCVTRDSRNLGRREKHHEWFRYNHTSSMCFFCGTQRVYEENIRAGMPFLEFVGYLAPYTP